MNPANSAASPASEPLTAPPFDGESLPAERTLILAAMKDEVAGLLAMLEPIAAPMGVDPGNYRLGRIDGADVVVAWTGEGAALAARGLESVLERLAVDRVLVVGVAGGLSPDLQTGDLVIGRHVHHTAQTTFLPDERWVDRALALPGALGGTHLTSRRMLCTAVEKAAAWTGRLRSTDNATVDLETAVWARIAAERGLPFLAVRAVCDTAREDFPFDLNECVAPDGRVNRLKVARRALLQPAAMRGLWSLRRRVRQCSGRLAEFTRTLLTAEDR